MRTGEGKTLVATLPSALNALTGRGVHVVTVNDYLARRDAEWMGPIHRFLGLTVGCIQNSLSDAERQVAYGCDITYGTNNEFGFDYLRDNMKFDLQSMVQRGYNFAIVDEVDSILIDEARTPLIISGPSEESPDLYYRANRVIPRLTKGTEEKDKDGRKYTTGDYIVDEKSHTAILTEEGVAKAEQIVGVDNLYDMRNVDMLHAVEQALKAHTLYRKDVEYVVKDGQVLIVDEFTGRILPGRRWSDGLHQAVEAKEGVQIEKENQTLATNMAGRGTDIILGGNAEAMALHRAKEAENPEAFDKLKRDLAANAVEEQKDVIEKGGLFIVGTERHESRRIDNQLRGRSGR